MITRRHLLLATSSIGAGTLLSACGKAEGEASGARTALTVGLTYIPNIQFSPFYVAVDEGIFSDLGLDVTLRHHGEQEDAFGALIAGGEQVVYASSDEAVVAQVNEPRLRTFATCYQTFPGVVIVPADSDIQTLSDLRGRTIGLPGHYGSSYYAILAGLHQAGMTEAHVSLVDIGYTQVTALMTEKVEAIVGFSNNDAVQFEQSGFAVRQIAVVDAAEPNIVGPGLIALEGTVEPSVLGTLAKGLAEAETRIVADANLALDATAKQVPALADAAQREGAAAVLAATAKLWTGSDGAVTTDVDVEAAARMRAFLLEADIITEDPGTSVLEV